MSKVDLTNKKGKWGGTPKPVYEFDEKYNLIASHPSVMAVVEKRKLDKKRIYLAALLALRIRRCAINIVGACYQKGLRNSLVEKLFFVYV